MWYELNVSFKMLANLNIKGVKKVIFSTVVGQRRYSPPPPIPVLRPVEFSLHPPVMFYDDNIFV